MTNKKYIIRNCPCLFNSYYASGKTVRFECNDGNHDDKLCRDVTDCVLKQIVELCRNKDYFVKRFPNAQFSSAVQNSELAFDILQLLQIEEVE